MEIRLKAFIFPELICINRSVHLRNQLKSLNFSNSFFAEVNLWFNTKISNKAKRDRVFNDAKWVENKNKTPEKKFFFFLI